MSMQFDTFDAHKLIRDWFSIGHALTACVHPNTTHVTGNHALAIIYARPTSATYNPVFIPSCKVNCPFLQVAAYLKHARPMDGQS